MKWVNNKFVIRAKILMDHIGNVAAKLEGAQSPDGNIKYPEVTVVNKTTGAWEDVTFDFATAAGTSPAYNYKRLTLFFDLLLPAGTADITSYIDDIVIGDGAGCGSTSGIFDAVRVERLVYFPNPVSNELTVKNTLNIKRFEITNMLGQAVSTVVLSNNTSEYQTISLENLGKGMYILSGYDEKGLVANSKFVKE